VVRTINSTLFYSTAIILFLVGLYGVLTRKNLLKILVSLSIIDTAVNIFIIAVGYIQNGVAPIITANNSVIDPKNIKVVDPLPGALVLTAIVIGVGTTAMALAITVSLYKKYKTLNIDEMDGDKDE
jgi:multicomponent Na+:H+ antiporter subunit C